MKIFKQKPNFYGWSYVLLIPFFGFIYLLMPKDAFEGDLDMDNFITCLYYSAVTVTTLGYGDISAKSIITQMLVMAETTLGVINIGLFLNSLSQQQAYEASVEEKQKQENEAFKAECKKVLRHNKLIEQNIIFYHQYVYQVTTPLANRQQPWEPNPEFLFQDMKDLYKFSLNMTDDHFKPVVAFYFEHLENLQQSIKQLLLDIEFKYWVEAETKCIDFLRSNKQYDYRSSLLKATEQTIGDKKASEVFSEMIENHTGPVELRPSFALNQYIALYSLIKYNLEFIKEFRSFIEDVKIVLK